MSRRLRDNLSSDYFGAANKLNSKHARRKIVAYVESYDDIYFWRTVLSSFEDSTRYFEVMLPSRVSLTKGKKQVLMNLIGKHVGQNMIACVDADYDYLLQGVTAVSEEVVNNPYVFHTYVYAIENFQCYAPGLHDVCVAVTLNDHAIFDFNAYLKEYSEAIYQLFIWNIWHYRKSIYGQFTITDFNMTVNTGRFNLQDPWRGLEQVRRKARRKVQQLQRMHPEAGDEIKALEKELNALGVTPQTTYLFVQGHHLFDTVVTPMLKKVCEKLIRDRQREIYALAKHNVQMHNELSSYTHSLESIVPMLKRSTGYMHSEPFKRLQKDIARFLGEAGNGGVGE